MPRSALFANKQSGGMFAIEDLSRSTGQRFFVHSGTGNSGSGAGRSPDSPCATLAQALALCTASKNDIIYVMPGHAESIAAATSIAVAGVQIIGLGRGENRPIFTFITSTAAQFDIDAADVTIQNLVFKAGVDSQLIMIDVNAAGFTIEGCDFLEGSSIQWLTGIDIGADRCTVKGNYFKSVAVGANNAMVISAAVDRVRIEDNEVFGDFADACIHNPTATVATRLSISRNNLTNLQSGDHAIELVSACTGTIQYNIANSSLAAAATRTAIDPGSCYCNENYGSDAVGDVNGVLNPAADS